MKPTKSIKKKSSRLSKKLKVKNQRGGVGPGDQLQEFLMNRIVRDKITLTKYDIKVLLLYIYTNDLRPDMNNEIIKYLQQDYEALKNDKIFDIFPQNLQVAYGLASTNERNKYQAMSLRQWIYKDNDVSKLNLLINPTDKETFLKLLVDDEYFNSNEVLKANANLDKLKTLLQSLFIFGKAPSTPPPEGPPIFPMSRSRSSNVVNKPPPKPPRGVMRNRTRRNTASNLNSRPVPSPRPRLTTTTTTTNRPRPVPAPRPRPSIMTDAIL
jgi:hypothetical protein